jgi:hypothetical protein
MKNVIVIHELDLEDNETSVIGVASSKESAENIISSYYGKHRVVSKRDIRDSMLEYSKVLEVEGLNGETLRVEVTLEWFVVDSNF